MQEAVGILTSLAGFLLAAVITIGVIYIIRQPLAQVLSRLVDDEVVVRFGVTFVLLIIGIKGLSAAFGFITHDGFRQFSTRLISLLDNLAGVVQWVAYIAALLFIGYSIRKWREIKE